MRVAAADTGTNSTRLLVADVGSDGSVVEVERLLEITRLGEGVDAAGTLGEAPMHRVTDALGRYAERARALGAERMLAVATSAARDASNGADFLARVAATGFEPRLLSGEEEAAATSQASAPMRPVKSLSHSTAYSSSMWAAARPSSCSARAAASPGRARSRPAACA